jgi:hypothetical protein
LIFQQWSDDIESANVLRELLRRNKTITELSIAQNAWQQCCRCSTGIQKCAAIQPCSDLLGCDLDDRDVSILANALAIRNASMEKLDLQQQESPRWAFVHWLTTMEAMSPHQASPYGLTPQSEGATILADALGRNAMPSLKLLNWTLQYTR